MPRFLRDLDAGNKAEIMVKDIMAKCGIDSVLSGRNSAHDLEHTCPCVFTSEVKYDLYAAKSGNIAIEYYNPKSNKPSGLSATKADLWFHAVTKPASVWVTTVQQLKEYTNTKPPHKIVDVGGDDNASMYLYRQDVIFDDIFKRVDNLSPDELRTLIHDLLKLSGKIW